MQQRNLPSQHFPRGFQKSFAMDASNHPRETVFYRGHTREFELEQFLICLIILFNVPPNAVDSSFILLWPEPPA